MESDIQAFTIARALKSLNWEGLKILEYAVGALLRNTPRPKRTPAQEKIAFAPGKKILTTGLRNPAYNGQIVTIESLSGRSAILTLGGEKVRLSAESMIPVPDDAEPFNESDVLFLKPGTAVRTMPGGKYGDREGCVFKVGKSKIAVILIDGYVWISSDPRSLIKGTQPPANPKMTVSHKHEGEEGGEPIGPIWIIDPTLGEPPEHMEFGKTYPGVTKTSWLPRSAAKALATYYGATYGDS